MKRWMKNGLALLLALTLCLGLMACGAEKVAAPEEKPAAAVQEPVKEAAPAEEVKEEVKEEVEKEPAPEPEQEPEKEAEPEKPAGEEAGENKQGESFTLGEVSGNSYYNKTFGLACTLDENWVVATREQLETIYGAAYSRLSETEMEELLDSGSTVPDFYAESYSGNTLNVQVTKLNAAAAVQSVFISDEDLVDQTIEGMGEYKDSMFSALGLTDGKLEKGAVEFLGKETPCVLISGTMTIGEEEYSFYETIVQHRSLGHLATITAAAYLEDNTPQVLACFTKK